MTTRIVFLLLIGTLAACKEAPKDKIVITKHFDNGEFEITEFNEDSIPHGHVKGYYSNGKLSYDFSYQNGIMNGVGKTYFESGNLNEDGRYIDGYRIGHHIYYYDTRNKVKAEAEYIFLEGKEYKNTFIEYDSLSGVVLRRSPLLSMTRKGDSLFVEMKYNIFESLRVIIGDYDSLYNLVTPQSLDTIYGQGLKVAVPLAKWKGRKTIRGFAQNYRWVKIEKTKRTSISRLIYLEYDIK